MGFTEFFLDGGSPKTNIAGETACIGGGGLGQFADKGGLARKRVVVFLRRGGSYANAHYIYAVATVHHLFEIFVEVLEFDGHF